MCAQYFPLIALEENVNIFLLNRKVITNERLLVGWFVSEKFLQKKKSPHTRFCFPYKIKANGKRLVEMKNCFPTLLNCYQSARARMMVSSELTN